MIDNVITLTTDWQLEKEEWIESIDAIFHEYGEEKTKELKTINHYVIRKGVAFRAKILTPHTSTPSMLRMNLLIPVIFPGTESREH